MPVDRAGNKPGKANVLGTLGSVMRRDWVGSPDLLDYYRFQLGARSNFSLALSGLTANADVQLLNTAGQIIASSSRRSKSPESIATTLNSGTYYVRVQSRDRIGAYYRLNVAAASIPVPEPPPPDSYQYYTFTYQYGNGESYSGYGYANASTYKSGQAIADSNVNEIGYYGAYQINSAVDASGSVVELNKVYVTSYNNKEDGLTYYPQGATGSNGLGSESGYLTSAQTSQEYFGLRTYAADVMAVVNTIDLRGFAFDVAQTSANAGSSVIANFTIQNQGNVN